MTSEIGTRIAEAREQRNLTQAGLASKCGFEQSQIAHYEAGRREPNIENLRRLCTGLRISADWLLNLESTGYEQGFRNGAFEAVEAMKEATRSLRRSGVSAVISKGQDDG